MSADMKAERYVCRLCDKDLSRSSYEQRVAHVKKCSKSKRQRGQLTTRSTSSGRIGRHVPSRRPVACWVAPSLGLEKHADAFAREEVSLDLAGTPTDSDLVHLGVTSPVRGEDLDEHVHRRSRRPRWRATSRGPATARP